MKKLYVFDIDGTLLDSVVHSITCFNKLLTDFNYPPYDLESAVEDYTSFREYILKHIDFSNIEVENRFVEIYTEEIQEESRPYEGIIDVLMELENQNLTLAICTNREELSIKELAAEVFGEIDFKFISGFRENVPDKPDPYRLNEVIEKLGFSKDETVYFGDKDVDVLAAQNAGVDMVLVKWGQGNGDDFNNPYPIAVIDSPDEILGLFD